MTFLQRHRSRFDQVLAQTRCLGPQGAALDVDAAVDWLSDRALEARRTAGSIFFVGVGAGDPQSHHFAAAFYRRLGIRGIALGETPFRTALGDPVRAAETLAQWFAKPGDLVVNLLESTPADLGRSLLDGATSLGLRTVSFARCRPDETLTPLGHVSLFIATDDACLGDSVQHFLVNAWIAAAQAADR